MQQISNNDIQVHHGDNVKYIRKMKGKKQYTLADECGWSQQTMSRLENCERIDDSRLECIAPNLGVTIDFIKNFNEKKAIYNFIGNSTFSGNSSQQYQPVVHNDKSIIYLTELFKKLIEEDQQKNKYIMGLGKTIESLIEEVKKLKKIKF